MISSIRQFPFLFKSAFILLLASSLTGCMTMQWGESLKVHEHLEPRQIFLARDGSVIIQVTSSYFHTRYGSNAYPYQSPPAGQNTEVSITRYTPRDRYLILTPDTLNALVQHSKQDSDHVCEISSIIVDFADKPSGSPYVQAIPDRFLAPSPLPDQVFSAYPLADARPCRMNELIPIRNSNATLNFAHLKIESRRDHMPLWSYPVLVVAAPSELAMGGALVGAGLTITCPTAVAIVVVWVPIAIGVNITAKIKEGWDSYKDREPEPKPEKPGVRQKLSFLRPTPKFKTVFC